jgi:cell division septum initiation protein DivIVA
MPKKDKKASKKDKGREPADVVEAVRGAVERTFQATAGGTEGARDRGRNLLDDVASAAQRIRESFDDLRVLEDVRGLRAEIEALSKRVAELEKKQAAAPAAAKPAAARKPAAKPAAARKPPAKAAAKPSAASTAAKTTGPKAKPTTAPRRKPAASRSTPASGS